MPKFKPDPVEDLEGGPEPESILSDVELQARYQAKFDAATPQWIRDWCNLPEHDGGWFIPMPLFAEHPLVKDGWICETISARGCKEPFTEQDTALIMPFFSGAMWEAQHFECCMMGLGRVPDSPPRERAKYRPRNYAELSPERQRIIDKRLNLLDWDGK